MELAKIYSEKGSSNSISSEGLDDQTDSQKYGDINIGQDLKLRQMRYRKKTSGEIF